MPICASLTKRKSLFRIEIKASHFVDDIKLVFCRTFQFSLHRNDKKITFNHVSLRNATFQKNGNKKSTFTNRKIAHSSPITAKMYINYSIVCLTAMLAFAQQSLSQTIKVQPYLQDASPNSMSILWETDFSEESIVEWGLTESLGNSATGNAENSNGTAMIHTVQLYGLQRFTKYYYRVITEDAVSNIFHFKTPPFASDGENVRIVAMSDMQRDGAHPNKFEEIVHDGVLDYLSEEFGGDVEDNLALVMIPGDLVPTGNSYAQWEDYFFDPSHDLFNHVPVYPVPGNHEQNTNYFFQYFKLPNNGTPGFEEHWWHKDYGNVRIIGLDSNSPFDGEEQLTWLDNVLANTCEADSIDFVFAQLHHPHKSELWTPGESDYTGEVIERLNEFTTACGKPSIHFFGHTHGYSRGYSRDHKHLWINVATAGGAIDNWGEFPNADYDEFAVSQDEYGFVMVEVSNNLDPKIVVKRISRGDQDNIVDNVLTDSLTVRLLPSAVNNPIPEYPVDLEIAPECVILRANAFASPNDAAEHGQSHWQVSLNPNNFDNPVAESWKNFENWYFEIDTQAEDDLTDEHVLGLEENTNYFWRVRYRDKELNWSGWCESTAFSTGASLTPPNLLLNNGAENDLNNWTTTEGIVEVLTDGECNGIAPQSGDFYFAVGGLCEESEVGQCVQIVDVSSAADSIDLGTYPVHFGGYFSNFSGSDLPDMQLKYLNEENLEIGSSDVLSSLNAFWTLLSQSETIPALTRFIRLELTGTRIAGADNDSYFDELFLRLGTIAIDCEEVVKVNNIPSSSFSPQVVPNPVSNEGAILLPNGNFKHLSLTFIDLQGKKIPCEITTKNGRVHFSKGSMSTGLYTFVLRSRGRYITSGKIIFSNE